MELYADSYNFDLNVCLLTAKPAALLGVWVSMLAFDLFTLTIIIINALQQPYRLTSEITMRLRRAGIALYMGLAAVRVLYIALTIMLPQANVALMLGFFLWFLVSVATSRLTLRMEAAVWDSSTDRTAVVWYEMTDRQPA
ncbi:hypothetical protein EW026_g5315 [Hermanssonia centrifuga]|uniref:Uncharacterized protein n=1 Tax=Hermanssonia centrifuga TaxID=98765 RepID=A0A4V3XA38_9APHY|nr:hypothetical protein EW026_g5315 [Hermanssonia centrifuga]